MTTATEEKTYKIKKDMATGKFKILNSEADELLEGYEDKEFGNPLDAGRFMKSEMWPKFKTTTTISDLPDEASEEVPAVPVPKAQYGKVMVGVDELSRLIAENTAKAMADFLAASTAKVDEADKEEAKVELQTAVEMLMAQKKYRIILNEQDGTDDPHQQFIGCNGVQWLIKRGMEVTVPEGIVNVIKECIYEKRIEMDDGEVIVKRQPRFSYTILGEAAA